ncbi:unnamed protein product [Somion occarium]|uniref:DUF6535 domain-containing protein n=1 Tax=Somion occarium TaxID=3059160 RepID=A0ABP1E1Y3_9APHY
MKKSRRFPVPKTVARLSCIGTNSQTSSTTPQPPVASVASTRREITQPTSPDAPRQLVQDSDGDRSLPLSKLKKLNESLDNGPSVSFNVKPEASKETAAALKLKTVLSSTAGNTEPIPESDAWIELDKRYKQNDQIMVKKWNDEIETLLIFAGLFSAVVASFNIEAYKMLLPDSNEMTNLLLQQISSQLASFTVNSGFLNSTHIPVVPQINFEPSSVAVRVNTYWFCSLVCSLIVASLGMLVKQWLRQYTDGHQTSPKERTCVRELRFRALTRWGVFGLMASLPTILQLALILFFLGLMEYLNSLHPTPFYVVSTLVGLWLLAHLVTTVLPTIRPTCPYKSPQALLLYASWSKLIRRKPLSSPSLPFFSWGLSDQEMELDSTLEKETLVTADATFPDNHFLEKTIGRCLRDLSPSNGIDCIRQILLQRVQARKDHGTFENTEVRIWNISAKSLTSVLKLLIDTLDQKVGSNIVYSRVPEWILDTLRFFNRAARRLPHILDGALGGQLTQVLLKLVSHSQPLISMSALLVLETKPDLCKMDCISPDWPVSIFCQVLDNIDEFARDPGETRPPTIPMEPLALCAATLGLATHVRISDPSEADTLKKTLTKTLHSMAISHAAEKQKVAYQEHVLLCAEYYNKLETSLPSFDVELQDLKLVLDIKRGMAKLKL